MHIESILRRLQRQPGFVYGSIAWSGSATKPCLRVHLRPRKGSRGVCPDCMRRRPQYDTQPARSFTFVPLWGIAVYFVYSMRRIECPRDGVKVELVPWASGKMHATHAFAWFIASWAKVLSWTETAKRFQSSWDTVFRCVEHAVRWGLEHRNLDGIRSVGVDDFAWKKGQSYLTLVYQIDHGCRRLLHIARTRKAEAFHQFFDMLGDARSKQILFVASDMWKAFRSVLKSRCSVYLHVLDRFHVAQHLSKAVDEVRRDEVRRLRSAGRPTFLTKTRWLLLKRPKNLSRGERGRLRDLVAINLRAVRAYLLKERFNHFWTYHSVPAARRFLRSWTTMALRARLPPFKKFVNTVRAHERELLNWIIARGKFAAGATEGFNNKARITTRKAYGFRSYEHEEIALYHALGDLPEPPWLAHRFG